MPAPLPPDAPASYDAVVPGVAEVVAWVGALSSGATEDAARVGAIRELEDLKARCAAAQARLSVALDDSQRAAHAAAGLPADLQGRGVASQVALARREAPARGSQHLGLARILVGEMPHTLAALTAGVLSEWRATILARETACLTLEHRGQIDADLCADPSRIEEWGDRRLAAEAKRIAYRLDPHAALARTRKAEADRRVTARPAPDTMAHVGALLPAAQGVAVLATLGRVADGLIGQGDARTRGQIMADTFVERLTGQVAPTAVPVAVNLTVSDETLLAGGHEPAWLEGHGPLPAQVARDLVADAVREAVATLRRLYAAPADGRLVAMDSSARTFPKALALFLDLRDQTCRTPWCDAPIRHHDHPWAWDAGGPTTADNGQGLCEQCNYAKQAPGWRARAHPGSPGSPHTVETTTPTGHRHLSTAPPVPVAAVPFAAVPSPADPAPGHGGRLVDLSWGPARLELDLAG